MVRLSVVLPTYNEATHIVDFLRDLSAVLADIDHEVVVVDDNSPDGTHARVEAFSRENPRIVPVLRVNEKGLATAVIEGMRRSRGTFVAVMDSDYQHPPATVPRLLAAAESNDADLVAASRYTRGGSDVGFGFVRRTISWGARIIAKVALPGLRRHRMTDPMTGFFLVRRDRVPFDRLRPRGYKILLEIIGRADLRRAVEIPYTFEARRAGESKLGIGTQVDYLLHVGQLALVDRENRRMASFALVGATGIVVNVGVLALLIEVFHWGSLGILPGMGDRSLYLGELAAGIVGREAGILWNFVFNDRFTFHDKRADAHAGYFGRMLRFHLVSLWSFLVYLLVYYPLLFAGLHYTWAAVLAILAGFIVNYVGNHRWTYQRRRETHDA